MITKKKAQEQLHDFEGHAVFSSMADINQAIDVLSILGKGSLDVYIPIKKLESFKNSLRKRGFSVQYVVFESLPNEAYITVIWDIADFNATETGKKIKE
jgi:hypothetical protein